MENKTTEVNVEEELIENLTRLTVAVQVRRNSETSQSSRRSENNRTAGVERPREYVQAKREESPEDYSIQTLGRKKFIDRKLGELNEVKKRGAKHPFNKKDIRRGVDNKNKTDKQVEQFLNFLTSYRTPNVPITVWDSDFQDLSGPQRKWLRNYAEDKFNEKWTGAKKEN